MSFFPGRIRRRSSPGRIRHRLATELSKVAGAYFEPHRIVQNNPMHIRYEDCCKWDAWGTITVKGLPCHIHVYSWDTMSLCLKKGFKLLTNERDLPHDYEVSAL